MIKTNTFIQTHQVNITKTQNLKTLKKECDAFEAEILNFFLKEA